MYIPLLFYCTFAFGSKVLEKGGPYPQVILPQFGGYWIEDVEAPAGTPTSSESSFCEDEEGGEGMSPVGGYNYRMECNSTARAYRKHFLGKVSVCPYECMGGEHEGILYEGVRVSVKKKSFI